MVKNLPTNAEDVDSILRSGRSPGEGNGSSLPYSCLGNCMDIGAWWTTVHVVLRELREIKHKRLNNNKTANRWKQCVGTAYQSWWWTWNNSCLANHLMQRFWTRGLSFYYRFIIGQIAVSWQVPGPPWNCWFPLLSVGHSLELFSGGQCSLNCGRFTFIRTCKSKASVTWKRNSKNVSLPTVKRMKNNSVLVFTYERYFHWWVLNVWS